MNELYIDDSYSLIHFQKEVGFGSIVMNSTFETADVSY